MSFGFWIPILVILAQKRDPNFGPADDKNALETPLFAISSPQKSMGGIVIDIWEKSNFFRSFGSQKGAKNVIFVQGGLKKPPLW